MESNIDEQEISTFIEAIASELKKAENDQQMLEIIEKEIIFLLGKTGSGKSTIANILARVELSCEKKNTRYLFSGEGLKTPIGNERRACTGIPVRVVDEVSNRVYRDVGGFADDRGTHMEVLISFCLKKLVEAAERIKVVLTLEYALIEANTGDLEKVMNIMHEIFPDTQLLIDKLFVIVTKVPQDISSEGMLEEFEQLAIRVNNRNTKAIFQSLAKDQNKSWIFRKPVSPEKWNQEVILQELLEKLERVPYLEKQAVNLSYSDTAKLKIRVTAEQIVRKLDLEIADICRKVGEICKVKIRQATSFQDLGLFLTSIVNMVNTKLESWWGQDIGNEDSLLEELLGFIRDFNLLAIVYRTETVDEERVSKLVEHMGVLTRISPETRIDGTNWNAWREKFSLLKPEVENITRLNPAVRTSPNTLTVNGIVLSLAQIKNHLRNERFKTLEIYCLGGIFLDDDLEYKGANLTIISPFWKVCGQCVIDLNGSEGVVLPRSSSFDGLPGQSGGNAGDFFGVGEIFQNVPGLTIKLNGGNGAPGEDGEDGFDGEWGLDKLQLVQKLDERALVTRKPVITGKAFLKDLITLNGQIKEVYEWEGLPGKLGKRGGTGGLGGLGGRPGQARIISQTREHERIKVEREEGKRGTDGRPGNRGRQGKTECCKGVYIREYVLPEYRGKYKKLKGYSKTKMVPLAATRIMRYVPHIASLVVHVGAPLLSPLILGVQLGVSGHLAIAGTRWKIKPYNFFKRLRPRETQTNSIVRRPVVDDREQPERNIWPFNNEDLRRRYVENYNLNMRESRYLRFQQLQWEEVDD